MPFVQVHDRRPTGAAARAHPVLAPGTLDRGVDAPLQALEPSPDTTGTIFLFGVLPALALGIALPDPMIAMLMLIFMPMTRPDALRDPVLLPDVARQRHRLVQPAR